MQVRIDRETFLKGLSKVLGVVERKTTMPMLSNTLLDATDDGKISLTGTNLDVGAIGSYEANVKKPGRVVLDAKRLHDIVRELEGSEVSLVRSERRSGDEEGTNYWVEVTAGKAKFRIAGLAPDEFPPLPDFAKAKPIKIEASTLCEMIDKTQFSISTDETRYNMSGVLFEALKDDKKLRMVSTDTHRLSLVDREVSTLPNLDTGVILPRKGVAELRKLAEEAGDADIEFGLSGTTAMARFDSYTLVMRLVEGTFPSYQQVVPAPESHNKTLTIDRTDFIKVLRRVSILSVDRIKGVKFEVSKKLLVLSASNPEFGEAREEFDAQYSGDDLVIGFNAKYILDALNVISGEKVEFLLNNDSAPGVLRDVDDPSFTYVIMPMRI